LAPADSSAAPGDLEVVAATGEKDFGEVGNPDITPAISADGRFIAYVEKSFEGDPLMLRDLRQATSTEVVPAMGIYHDVVHPSISADGRYLAFASNIRSLLGRERKKVEGQADIVFVYDGQTGRLRVASRRGGRDGAIASGGYPSTAPSISADGRRIAFETESPDLSTNRRETIGGIYERDLANEVLRPVSAVPGVEYWTPGSYGPALSGDGRRVAFTFEYGRASYDPEHPPHPLDVWLHRHHKQVVVKDRAWRRPVVVSRASGPKGALSDGRSREAAISGTGRYVAFVSRAHNLVTGDRDGVEDIFVRDLRTDRTTLVSTDDSGRAIADGDSSQPSVSADGRFIAFLSEADLLPNDGDDKLDVYLKDLSTGRLTLVTEGPGTEPSNGRFGGPAISADGFYIAFGSTSSNLDPEVPDHQLTYYRYAVR
jgi:Tol biopolymer transport system component